MVIDTYPHDGYDNEHHAYDGNNDHHSFQPPRSAIQRNKKPSLLMFGPIACFFFSSALLFYLALPFPPNNSPLLHVWYGG